MSRGVASRKQVRGPQHNILTIANVKQDIESILKYDKSEGAMAPLGPCVATPVFMSNDIPLIGTPATEADYGSLTQQSIPEFSQSTRARQVPVTIINDDLTEDSEMFGAGLSNPVVLVGGVEQTLAASEASRIRIQPDTASVVITDNDG